MSRSETAGHALTRFDDWVAHEFGRTGGFTALVVLVDIGELSVTPLKSTWFHIIGGDIDWAGVAGLLAGSGVDWHGALFASRSAEPDGGGPVADTVARHELQDLTERLQEDRLVLNENHFFDRWGRRLRIEEVTTQ